MRVIVTGACGFVAYHVSKALLERGDELCCFDSMNPYYSQSLKEDRGKDIGTEINIMDVANPALKDYFYSFNPDIVVHLAAQAGVRHSISHPEEYTHNNLVAFMNVIECCRRFKVPLVYASSSSVYGG